MKDNNRRRRKSSNSHDECDMVLNYTDLKRMVSNIPDGHDNLDNLINDVSTLVDECHNHTNKDDDRIYSKCFIHKDRYQYIIFQSLNHSKDSTNNEYSCPTEVNECNHYCNKSS